MTILSLLDKIDGGSIPSRRVCWVPDISWRGEGVCRNEPAYVVFVGDDALVS